MQIHNWTQDTYEPRGEWFGVITCLQNFKCRNCGAKGTRPDDGSLPDVGGCAGLVARPKVVRVNPLESREDEKVEHVKNSKHYQQKKR